MAALRSFLAAWLLCQTSWLLLYLTAYRTGLEFHISSALWPGDPYAFQNFVVPPLMVIALISTPTSLLCVVVAARKFGVRGLLAYTAGVAVCLALAARDQASAISPMRAWLFVLYVLALSIGLAWYLVKTERSTGTGSKA